MTFQLDFSAIMNLVALGGMIWSGAVAFGRVQTSIGAVQQGVVELKQEVHAILRSHDDRIRAVEQKAVALEARTHEPAAA
jgi:uncharacterized membrane protein